MVSTEETAKPALDELLERLTLGVSKSLEKRVGVCDVSLSGGNPTERHQIVSWEQRNACMLPDDLKNFYLTTDGLLLTWSVCVEGNKFPVGRMEINPFSKLVKISSSASTATPSNTASLADAESHRADESDSSESDDESGAHNQHHRDHPYFDGRSRIFELESCQGYGKVCLVYLNTSPGLPAHKPEIWFLDRSLMWHFLACDFTSYYRLMLMHLGLPQWQFALTDISLSLQAKQWFNMYAPVRQSLDKEYNAKEKDKPKVITDTDPAFSAINKIDFSKLFKGKSIDKVKPKQAQNQTMNKRKPNVQNFSSSTSIKSTNSSRTILGRQTKPWT